MVQLLPSPIMHTTGILTVLLMLVTLVLSEEVDPAKNADLGKKSPEVFCITKYNLTVHIPFDSTFAWQGTVPVTFHEVTEIIPFCLEEAPKEEVSFSLVKAFLKENVHKFKPRFGIKSGILSSSWHKGDDMHISILDIKSQNKMSRSPIVVEANWGYSLRSIVLEKVTPSSLNAQAHMTSFLLWPDGAAKVAFQDTQFSIKLKMGSDLFPPNMPRVTLGQYTDGKVQDNFNIEFGVKSKHVLEDEESNHETVLVLEPTSLASMQEPTDNSLKVALNFSIDFAVPESARAKLEAIPDSCYQVFQEEQYTRLWVLVFLLWFTFIAMQPFFAVDIFALQMNSSFWMYLMYILKAFYGCFLVGVLWYIFQESVHRTCYVLYTDCMFPKLQYIAWTVLPSLCFAWLGGIFLANIYSNKQLDKIASNLLANYMGKEGKGRMSVLTPIMLKAAPPIVLVAVIILEVKLYCFDIDLIGPLYVTLFALAVIAPLWLLKFLWNPDRRISVRVMGVGFVLVPIAALLGHGSNAIGTSL